MLSALSSELGAPVCEVSVSASISGLIQRFTLISLTRLPKVCCSHGPLIKNTILKYSLTAIAFPLSRYCLRKVLLVSRYLTNIKSLEWATLTLPNLTVAKLYYTLGTTIGFYTRAFARYAHLDLQALVLFDVCLIISYLSRIRRIKKKLRYLSI